MNHHLRMLLGCMLPLLLIFILPLFGVRQGGSLFIFMILMFAGHLMMMGGHLAREHNRLDKEKNHEQS